MCDRYFSDNSPLLFSVVEKGSLPLWLRCLIACCYQVDDFDIQSTSVSTVLDMINLTLSVNPGVSCARAGVMVIPILTLDEVVMIEKSDIYKVSSGFYGYRLL
jgi:hypothetical protein